MHKTYVYIMLIKQINLSIIRWYLMFWRNIDRRHPSRTKNMSCFTTKFKHITESANQSLIKSNSKFSITNYKTESKTHAVNSPFSGDKNESNSGTKNKAVKKGKFKILSNKRSRRDQKCLIQPPPSMKSVSNYKTMREASLPRSISWLSTTLVDTKKRSDKSRESRNINNG
jgi:hypothetical protein